MNAQAATSQYMLLFRGTDWDHGLSAEEIQVVMTRWITWFDDLIRQDKAKLGQPLKDEARIVSGREGQSLRDGPSTESKEVVAGYILLRVGDFDEATQSRSSAQVWITERV